MDLLFCYFSEGRILGDLESCLEANFEKNLVFKIQRAEVWNSVSRVLEFNLIFDHEISNIRNSRKRNYAIKQYPLDHRSMCCSDTFLIHVSPTRKATLTRTRSTSCQTSYTLITFLISPRTIPFIPLFFHPQIALSFISISSS